MKPSVLLALTFLLLSPQVVFSQDSKAIEKSVLVYELLLKAKSLRCEIGPGTYVDYEQSGTPLVKPTSWAKDAPLQFDAIDLSKGKARLIGKQGATDVTVSLGHGSIHFVEETGSGNLILSTVFAYQVKGGFAFVMSRHMMLFGPYPLPSQYYGTCKIWEIKR